MSDTMMFDGTAAGGGRRLPPLATTAAARSLVDAYLDGGFRPTYEALARPDPDDPKSQPPAEPKPPPNGYTLETASGRRWPAVLAAVLRAIFGADPPPRMQRPAG